MAAARPLSGRGLARTGTSQISGDSARGPLPHLDMSSEVPLRTELTAAVAPESLPLGLLVDVCPGGRVCRLGSHTQTHARVSRPGGLRACLFSLRSTRRVSACFSWIPKARPAPRTGVPSRLLVAVPRDEDTQYCNDVTRSMKAQLDASHREVSADVKRQKWKSRASPCSEVSG